MSDLIRPFKHNYTPYLSDESRLLGYADSISFPSDEKEVLEVISVCSKQAIPITIQGSRTGITGGAVPLGGHILNLSKMNRVTGISRDTKGTFLLRVQPGLVLEELNRQLSTRSFDTAAWETNSLEVYSEFQKAGPQIWPVDPTEKSATIGGIAANNGSGLCHLKYGSAKDNIRAVRFISSNGRVIDVQRGEYCLKQGNCRLPCGEVIDIDNCMLEDGSPSDLVDLLLGSEGVLGVIVEITLELLPSPAGMLGACFFFTQESHAASFIDELRSEMPGNIAAVEFVDKNALDCLKRYKEVASKLSRIPDIDEQLSTLVYIEIHDKNAELVEQTAELLLEIGLNNGADPETIWAFSGDVEIEEGRLLRNSVPEAVNSEPDKIRNNFKDLTKLATDFTFPETSFTNLLWMYRTDLQQSNIYAAIFGHAAEGRLHVNLLPGGSDEYDAGRKIIEKWVAKAKNSNGTIISEHGHGKLRKYQMECGDPIHVRLIKRLKQIMDPGSLFGRGTMFNKNELQE